MNKDLVDLLIGLQESGDKFLFHMLSASLSAISLLEVENAKILFDEGVIGIGAYEKLISNLEVFRERVAEIRSSFLDEK